MFLWHYDSCRSSPCVVGERYYDVVRIRCWKAEFALHNPKCLQNFLQFGILRVCLVYFYTSTTDPFQRADRIARARWTICTQTVNHVTMDIPEAAAVSGGRVPLGLSLVSTSSIHIAGWSSFWFYGRFASAVIFPAAMQVGRSLAIRAIMLPIATKPVFARECACTICVYMIFNRHTKWDTFLSHRLATWCSNCESPRTFNISPNDEMELLLMLGSPKCRHWPL